MMKENSNWSGRSRGYMVENKLEENRRSREAIIILCKVWVFVVHHFQLVHPPNSMGVAILFVLVTKALSQLFHFAKERTQD